MAANRESTSRPAGLVLGAFPPPPPSREWIPSKYRFDITSCPGCIQMNLEIPAVATTPYQKLAQFRNSLHGTVSPNRLVNAWHRIVRITACAPSLECSSPSPICFFHISRNPIRVTPVTRHTSHVPVRTEFRTYRMLCSNTTEASV